MRKLSVIIPSYNEENRIKETLLDVHNTLSKQNFDYEIIVVNDGSKDKTSEVVKSVIKKIPKLSLIDNEKNHGKGWVVKQGILIAKGDIRLFMDADNSTRIVEVIKMLPYFGKGFDIVVGSRCIEGSNIAVKQSKIRIFLGFVLRTTIHILIPVGVVDSQCGFKVFTEKSAKEIFPKQTIFGWVFDVEILSLARKHNLKIKEVPITWVNNTESHITFFGMLSMVLEIMKISFRFSFSRANMPKYEEN